MIFGKPIQVTHGVFQFRVLGARITVLIEDGRAILVDTGLQGSLLPITGGLKDLGLTLDHIDTVAITHAHPDHCGGLGELVERTEIKVAAHRLDAGFIEGTTTPPNPLCETSCLPRWPNPYFPSSWEATSPSTFRSKTATSSRSAH